MRRISVEFVNGKPVITGVAGLSPSDVAAVTFELGLQAALINGANGAEEYAHAMNNLMEAHGIAMVDCAEQLIEQIKGPNQRDEGFVWKPE